MKSITIRGIDDQTAELLKQKASSEQKKHESAAAGNHKKSLGLAEENKVTAEYHDLDYLFGQWSEAEFAAIQGKISRERQIDKEFWQ